MPITQLNIKKNSINNRYRMKRTKKKLNGGGGPHYMAKITSNFTSKGKGKGKGTGKGKSKIFSGISPRVLIINSPRKYTQLVHNERQQFSKKMLNLEIKHLNILHNIAQHNTQNVKELQKIKTISNKIPAQTILVNTIKERILQAQQKHETEERQKNETEA